MWGTRVVAEVMGEGAALCYGAPMIGDDTAGLTASSPLSGMWKRLTGRDRWPPVTATVFSVEFVNLPDQVDASTGRYHVVYSYSVDGERYTGRFADYGMADESYLKRGDTIEVRYNPRDPAASFFSDLRTDYGFRLICGGIGFVTGVAVLVISWFRRHGRL